MYLSAYLLWWFYSSYASNVLMMILQFLWFSFLWLFYDSLVNILHFIPLCNQNLLSDDSYRMVVGYVFYGKAKLLEKSYYTYSTCVTTRWAGPLICIYQYLTILGCRLSDKIMLDYLVAYNKLTAPKLVLLRRSVSNPRDIIINTTNTGIWHTTVSWNLLMASISSLIFPTQY